MILIKIQFDTDMALILTLIWTNGPDLDLNILIMILINGPGLDPNSYFIPQATTSALSSSRKYVEQLAFCQIVQNTVTILLFSVNSAVIILSKICWFYSLDTFLKIKTNN